jgi:sugar phosphate isomerase/epimerase
MPNVFRLGTSLFSLQLEYVNYQWSFEDCMQLASQTGGDKGLEIVGPMHHRCWPGLSREFERQFKSGCERWEVIPTSYGSYAEMNMYVDLDSRFEFHVLQMNTAKQLGFPLMRVQTPGVDPILERLAPVAEKMKLKLAVEITQGRNLMEPQGTFIETVRKIHSEYIGLNPDCNMFEDRRKERGGLGPAGGIGGPGGGRGAGGPSGGRGGPTVAPQRIPAADYEKLAEVMPWVIHMHAKFHWAEKGTIPAVPFDKITDLLIKRGFKGWMSTEFEGGELGEYQNSFEIVKVHHAIVKRAIAKYTRA